MPAKPRVLVLHSLYEISRKTVRQHLACYARYLPEIEVVYQHFRAPITPALRQTEWDLVILNFCVLSNRGTRAFRQIMDLYSFLPQQGCPIVAIPQDDVINCAYLDEWLYRWDVRSVYTPRDYGQDQIYVHTRRKAHVEQVLPGYVDENLLETVTGRSLPWSERPIDIGSRVRFHPYRCGWFGRLKGTQAVELRKLSQDAGFNVDISTQPEDSFVGMPWFDFLGSCRFTVARRGGSSLLDPYGEIKRKIDAYLMEHEDPSFEDVEANCFPGLDNPTPFTAVTPRIFDATLMRTCLILTPDNYLNLKPYEHYLPLEDDLSNADELFEAMRDEKLVNGIVDNAWEELIASGRYTYRAFAEKVVGDNLEATSGSATAQIGEHTALIGDLEGARGRLGPDLFEAFRRMLIRAENQDALGQLRHGLELDDDRESLDVTLGRGPSNGLSKLTRAEVELLRQIHGCEAAPGCRTWLDALEVGHLDPLGRQPWLSLDPFDEAGP